MKHKNFVWTSFLNLGALETHCGEQVCFRWLLLGVLEYIAVASEGVFPMRRTFPTVFALVGMMVVNCMFV